MRKLSVSALRNKALAATFATLGMASVVSAAPQLRSTDALSATGTMIHYSGVEDGRTYGRFIVKYRDADESSLASPQSMSTALAGIDRIANAFGRNLSHVRRLGTGADLVEVQGPPLDATDARALLAQFGGDPNVEYVEADAMMRALLTPNDTRYNEQWHYFEATAGMNLPAAWDIGTGSGVTVAVIDTGITPHDDLSANVVAGYDFISDATAARDGNGRDSNPNDEGDWFNAGECGLTFASGSSWHGTHVAGTVAAVTNNANGVAGVAFNARVQPVRALGKCGGTLSDIADAIVWASGGRVNGIPTNATVSKVINMSLGGGGACGSTYQNAIDAAVGRGTVVVVSAGNENQDVSNQRPANCSNVVAVAAIDRQGNRASYSNFGTLVDVGAPGGETVTQANGILSTLNTGSQTQGRATYAFYQGTSMAAPHVAGLSALVLGLDGSLTPAQVETFIKDNTRPLAGACSGGCGTGLVNAVATLQAVGGGDPSFFENQTDFAILDHTTIASKITVSGRTGNAPATLQVAVTIFHTYKGNLKVSLLAPDGSVYVLHNRTGGSADNIIQTFIVNASSEPANGKWKLRVNDNADNDTGTLDKWSLQF